MLSIIALLTATPAAGPPLPAICLTEPDAAAMLVRVPFRIVDGRIYLDVQVNGEGPFTFAVDTGASGIGRADLSLVKALALPLAETGAASDGVSTATVPTTTLAELRLGDHVMRNVEVIARDYSGRMPPRKRHRRHSRARFLCRRHAADRLSEPDPDLCPGRHARSTGTRRAGV